METCIRSHHHYHHYHHQQQQQQQKLHWLKHKNAKTWFSCLKYDIWAKE